LDYDADGDIRRPPHFSPQTAAEYPRDHNHRQPDQHEIKINSIIRDGVIQKTKHGVQNFARVQVHIASLVWTFRILTTGSTILERAEELFRICSYALSGGSSTCARRAYARCIALLL